MALERSLPVSRVNGEIANFSRAGSGHWYFTLKDAQASVRCVMFKLRNQFVDWQPKDGEQVELKGQATLYEPRGDFQIQVESLIKAGQGSLFEAFLKLKARLQSEGLFDEDRKRALPRFPKTIGIITSPQAAALRDVLATLTQRWPSATAILYPTTVQGFDAARDLTETIRVAGDRGDCEALLLVRGGGSLEDLYSFNDETVARAVADCPIPIVSGVGHETDFTIVDFVADYRAPTPTGAAIASTPSRVDWQQQLSVLQIRMRQAIDRQTQALAQKMDNARARIVHPNQRITMQRQLWKHLAWRLSQGMENITRKQATRLSSASSRLLTYPDHLATLKIRFETLRPRLRSSQHHWFKQIQSKSISLASQLEILNPTAVLSRGYSIVRDDRQHVIRSSTEVSRGQELELLMAEGELLVSVLGVKGSSAV